MPSPLETVRPGDLITAQQMNRLIDRIETLEEQVAALQSVGPSPDAVAITSTIPDVITEPVRIGQRLRVLGRNFEFSIGATRVSVDGELVTSFEAGTNDQILIFDIPDVPGVTLAGRSAILSVSNRDSLDQRTILRLLPAQNLQGAIDVVWLDVNPGNVDSGDTGTFRFRLRSRANQTAVYSIQPELTTSDSSQEWRNSIQVLDQLQNVISSRTISVAAGGEQIFHVRMTIPTSVSTGTPYTLTVNASAQNISGTSGPIPGVVGQPFETPLTEVSLSFSDAQFSPPGSGSIQSGSERDTIRMNAGANGMIILLAGFRQAGTYDVIVEALGQTSDWQLSRHPQFTPPQIQVSEADLQNPQGQHNLLTRFLVSPGPNASSTGEVAFRIRQQGTNRVRTLIMGLAT